MLVLLTSVHPWNYNRIYQKILVNRFLELKAKYGIQQKDLDNYEFERILSKMPEKDALTFNNTISDIQSYGYIWSRSVLGENCQWVYHNDGKKIKDVDGDILVVSQFTLWASYKKGNRPSYLRAGSHDIVIPLYEKFCTTLSFELGKPVETGEFGAEMQVELVNDGPVTICMDTKNKE